MTLTEKILARHAGLPAVRPGQLIEAEVDLCLANDITAPVAIAELEKAGIDKVFADKIVLVMDHFVPNKDIKSAQNVKCVRDFAKKHGVEKFFDVGQMGIEHALVPDKGFVKPYDLVIGADSHTCTYGALCAFSTGVGSTDFAAGMSAGRLWFKVPGAIKVELSGELSQYVSGKDVILHLIGEIGVAGALYRSLEFVGEGVASLSMADRFTICNMAIEAGAKNGIFPVDEKTERYLAERGITAPERLEADADAVYERVVKIDLSALRPTVALPSLPGNSCVIDNAPGDPIDQVVVGSCTNGRIEDLRAAASVLAGRKVKKGVRLIVIPATQEIYLTAMREGLLETFIEAGGIVSTPTCGPCLGGYMGILAEGETCVATTNRNFVGRMGHTGSKVILASPLIAACAAVMGRLATPEEVFGEEKK